MKPANPHRVMWISCVIAVAFSWLTSAQAAPLRVMLPGRSNQSPPAVLCVAEFLVERLPLCKGVDIVQGDRVGKVNASLGSGALELTEEERWKRLSLFVAIDAMISVTAPGVTPGVAQGAEGDAAASAATATSQAVEVTIFHATGITRLKAVLPNAGPVAAGALDLPHAMAALATRVARELKLNDEDTKTLGTTRIDDPSYFRLYYSTKTAHAAWAANPFTSAMISVAALPRDKTHWAGDATILRTAASYIEWTGHGRESDKLSLALSILRAPFFRLLGTDHEEEAYPLLRLARGAQGEPLLAEFESLLMQIAKPLVTGGVESKASEKLPRNPAATKGVGDLSDVADELNDLKPGEKTRLGDAFEKPNDLTARTGRNDYTPAERISALRMLGVMASPKAVPLLVQASKLSDWTVRQTAIEALANYKGDAGLTTLTGLATDPDDKVAFMAGRSLLQRGQPPAELAGRAKAMLQQPEPYRTWAAEALASVAAKDDEALRARLSADEAPTVRATLRRALLGAVSSKGPRLTEVMKDCESEAVIAAIRRVVADALKSDSETYQCLVRLVNDPDANVAQSARDALWPLRPTDPMSRARFDVAVGEPYMRLTAVAVLKRSKEPAARTDLIAACDNPDARVRIAALQALLSIDPASAAAPLMKAVADPHLLVRFHAAVLLAPIATAAQADAIRQAIPRQRDRATALYLADALAHAEGKPPPPATQPAANSVAGEGNMVWLFGSSSHEPHSPYRHYFKTSHGNHVRDDPIRDEQKAGHANGSAYIYNIGPSGEPGQYLVGATGQDGYWIYLDDHLDTPHLPFIDGVTLGFGGIAPDALWPSAWRSFCDQCRIDPQRVDGQLKNLNPYEARAWKVWSRRRCVEGRNLVYDYVKLKFGKLHPGVQIATSIGRGAGAAEFDLKFDFAFVPDSSDARTEIYNVARRAKTVWPQRTVVWHGMALQVEDLGVIKYDFKTPTQLITGRSHRAYINALTAWMAGADTGWSSNWAFRALNWTPPSYAALVVTPEDLIHESPRLRAGVELAFEGTDAVYRGKSALDKAHNKKLGLAPTDQAAKMDDLIDEIEKPSGPDTVAQRIALDKEQMFLGFQIYGKHTLDLARLFASLPRYNPAPEALVIEVTDAKAGGGTNPGAGAGAAADLLASYDVLYDINDVVRLDLKRYRLITVSDPDALEDATIAAIVKWLRNTPGVLYVHRDLTADNARQAGTPEQFDGRLRLDWPWENDVTLAPITKPVKPAGGALKLATADGTALNAPGGTRISAITLAGSNTRAILTSEGAPALAVWQHPEFKGAVFFDGIEGGGAVYRQAVRRALADLHASSDIGAALASTIRHESIVTSQFIADATAGSGDGQTVKGVDLLTGELNPVVGPTKSAAFVARDFRGRFAAAGNGISVLCDRPIRKMEKVPGGLLIECEGLIQAASETGKLEATPNTGTALTAIKEDRLVRWVVTSSEEGITTQKIGDGTESQPSELTFIRCKRPVTLRTR